MTEIARGLQDAFVRVAAARGELVMGGDGVATSGASYGRADGYLASAERVSERLRSTVGAASSSLDELDAGLRHGRSLTTWMHTGGPIPPGPWMTPLDGALDGTDIAVRQLTRIARETDTPVPRTSLRMPSSSTTSLGVASELVLDRLLGAEQAIAGTGASGHDDAARAVRSLLDGIDAPLRTISEAPLGNVIERQQGIRLLGEGLDQARAAASSVKTGWADDALSGLARAVRGLAYTGARL